MLKWFKDRKKRRKSSKSSQHCPEQDDDEHIYAEIVDLPRLANVEGWVRDVNSQSVDSDSENNQSGDDPEGGGPYMVVPLIPGNRKKNESESLTSFGCSATTLSRQESVVSGSAESTSSAADFSYDSGTCQRSESNSDHGVDSYNRRTTSSHSVRSSGLSSVTDGSYDSGAQMTSDGKNQLNGKNHRMKNEQISKSCKTQKRRNKTQYIIGSSESNSVKDSSLGSGLHRSDEQVSKTQRRKSKAQYRTGSSGSSSVTDSCFEYDVKTSSDDEQANDYFISKMRENLQLKYSLQETVRVRKSTGTLDRNTNRLISGSCCDSVDVDPSLTLRNHDADDGALADQSDSDNSSGYYDSCLRKTDRVHSAFSVTSTDPGDARDLVNLYDTPDTGTICLNVNGHADSNVDNFTRPRKLERSKIKTVCTPKLFDISIEPKSAFRPVQNSKTSSGFVTRTLSYKRNNSVSGSLSYSLKSNELQTNADKIDAPTNRQLKQRSRSVDNLHILTSATSGRKPTRLSTPACQRKFSQLSLAPSLWLMESIDKDLNSVSDFFAKTSTDKSKPSSEVYSLPNFVPIGSPKKKPEVTRSRDACSADIYRSPGRNNRLLSDLIMSNYSQRQFVVR